MRIAVLGAGPIGLDAALAGVADGHDVTVLEATPCPASGVRAWGHVHLPGETACGRRVVRTIPDVTANPVGAWAGTTLLVGAGKSAQTAARSSSG